MIQCTISGAQDNNQSWNWAIGPELQVYPTGILPGLRIQKSINDKSLMSLRIGANIFDHRDLGVQDEETGNGFGLTLGYHRQLLKNNDRWMIGIRTDLWWNEVDWETTNENVTTTGVTDIVVLQPTAELVYLIPIGDHGWQINPSAAFGLEWNIKTDGAETGEGPILLGGIQFLKTF